VHDLPDPAQILDVDGLVESVLRAQVICLLGRNQRPLAESWAMYAST